MTKEKVYLKLISDPPPELFRYDNEQLYGRYDDYLNQFDIRSKEDAGLLIATMNELYEDILRHIHTRSIKEYREGEIDDTNDLPLIVRNRKGEKEIQNIPLYVADWIGLIAYARKKLFE